MRVPKIEERKLHKLRNLIRGQGDKEDSFITDSLPLHRQFYLPCQLVTLLPCHLKITTVPPVECEAYSGAYAHCIVASPVS